VSIPSRDPIDGAGEARADGHHAATARPTIVRLHYEMRVIAL
jgi:hypothetical protein